MTAVDWAAFAISISTLVATFGLMGLSGWLSITLMNLNLMVVRQ
jgi:hypothetical protein